LVARHREHICAYFFSLAQFSFIPLIFLQDGNRAFIFIYNSSGKQFGDAIEVVLDPEKEKERLASDKKYDEYNQLVEYRAKSCLSCLDTVTFRLDYKYDERGNWTRMDTYVLGKRRIKKSTTKRTITYRT
jgi:hypothetical protein